MKLFNYTKKGVVLLSFLLITSSVFSQFTIGPKVGYNSSKLSLDRNDISSDLKNNFQIGLFMRIGSKIYIQPEINWLTQGSIFKTDPTVTNPFEQEVKLNTVQVPLMIGAKLIDLKMVNFRIFGGPTASIIASKTIENKVSEYISPLKEADIEDMLWSAQVGAGLDIFKFTLDIRYNFGVNNVIKTANIPGIGDNVELNTKTNGFNVTLGLKLF